MAPSRRPARSILGVWPHFRNVDASFTAMASSGCTVIHTTKAERWLQTCASPTSRMCCAIRPCGLRMRSAPKGCACDDLVLDSVVRRLRNDVLAHELVFPCVGTAVDNLLRVGVDTCQCGTRRLL